MFSGKQLVQRATEASAHALLHSDSYGFENADVISVFSPVSSTSHFLKVAV